MDRPPRYVGIFLTAESRVALLDRFEPKHPHIYGGHMTAYFHPDDATARAFLSRWFNRYVTLTVIGYAEDERGQAVVVKGGESANNIAHITISCAEGTKPAYSNELLARGFQPVEPFTVEGLADRARP